MGGYGGFAGGYRGPAQLPTDAGYTHVGATNVNVQANHNTQAWSNNQVRAQGNNIQQNWQNAGAFHGAGAWYGQGWYAQHPGCWAPQAGWHGYGTAYPYAATATAAGLGAYIGSSAVSSSDSGDDGGGGSYDYGNTVVYQGDTVYVDGQPAGTARQYYQQASQIAGQGQAPAGAQWQPVGVFGLVQPTDTTANQVFQIAVDQQGNIGGNYTNVLTNTVLPIKGSVDKQTGRAAWTVGSNTQTVYEAGLANLTNNQTPCLVHQGASSTEQFLLVKLPPPAQGQVGGGRN